MQTEQIISWEDFERDTRALADVLRKKGNWRALVAVARGGLVPASLIAQELKIRVIETLSVASYEERERGMASVLKGLSRTFAESYPNGQGVLVVDDLVDTGLTARVVRELMPEAHHAVVYAKPDGLPLADTYYKQVPQNTWLIFPWEG